MQADAYFFDFDGVLVDSVDIKARAFALLFEDHGWDIQERVVTHHLNYGGMTRTEKIKYYFETYLNQVISEELLATYCEKFSLIVEQEVVVAPEIPGAENFLKHASKQIKCFIVSATPDDELHRIVVNRGLKQYFIEILGSSRSKTENLNYLLEKYKFDSKKCKFFGDAINDYDAAINCSVPFIGIVSDNDAPLYEKALGISWCCDFHDKNIDPVIGL